MHVFACAEFLIALWKTLIKRLIKKVRNAVSFLNAKVTVTDLIKMYIIKENHFKSTKQEYLASIFLFSLTDAVRGLALRSLIYKFTKILNQIKKFVIRKIIFPLLKMCYKYCYEQ